jgi:lipoyl(octanoyl) transferase
MPLFKLIDLFVDQIARSGPEQMALDEALLERAERPLLRPYRWTEETVSFGYSQSLSQVLGRVSALPCVRRWTGGGIVVHQRDWTFALIVPSDDPLASVRPEVAYGLIHAEVLSALTMLGCDARLVDSADRSHQMVCFAAPVLHDIIGPDGRKLCGGAQRRTRRGILHQGSIQNLRLPEDFADRLVDAMADQTGAISVDSATLARAHELVALKYGTSTWLGRV